jgi:hypothetical protein
MTRRKQRKAKRRILGSSKYSAPQTATDFFAMPEKLQQIYLNVLELISRMRSGMSRRQATRELKLTSRQVGGFGRRAMRKLKNGRYVATAYDHLLRVVLVITPDGLLEVGTVDSREGSRAGRHSAAVHKYLQTGDASALAQFKGKHIIDAAGGRIELLTDLEELEQLGSAGVLSFETIYARGL